MTRYLRVMKKALRTQSVKAFNAIPQILIDYESSQLGTTSGEALRQASEFYNLADY